MRKKLKILAALFAFVLIFAAVLPTASLANSAEVVWQGLSASGVVITDGKSPLRVMHELLEFNIPEFPSTSADASAEKYSASVRAEYTINNPAEYQVTSRLLFPFGNKPMYFYTDENFDDIEKFSIKLDGEDADYTLRHTYSPAYEEFNLEKQLSRLSDDYVNNGIFSPDTTLIKYTFSPESIPEGATSVLFSLTLAQGKNRKILTDNCRFYEEGEGNYKIGFFAKADEEIVIYALGKRIPELEDVTLWKSYENEKSLTELDVKLICKSREEMSFSDLAMTSYNEKGEVSPVDWFNAVAFWLSEGLTDSSLVRLPSAELDVSESLMRWYDYYVTVGADETVVNTVSAPIYPNKNGRYSPRVYHYNYLSTPAKTWSSFGSVTVIINTPYKLVDVYSKYDRDFAKFEKNDRGYEIYYHTLPDYDISFSLSESENPEYIPHSSEGSGWIPPELETVLYIGLGVLVAAVTVTVAVVAAKSVKSAKEKERRDICEPCKEAGKKHRKKSKKK